jgi:hypothetical protein
MERQSPDGQPEKNHGNPLILKIKVQTPHPTQKYFAKLTVNSSKKQ